MNVLVLSSSPNTDGLTAACASAAVEGVQQGGSTATAINLNELDIQHCEACDNGWGTCREKHRCQIKDDFLAIHDQVREADAYILVTPVYWGDLSESAKAFTDRLRRVEATRQEESALVNKPVMMVAAAGGSGNGMITCLQSMERWIEHVRARKFDFIPVNRWNRAYKIDTIRVAAKTMVTENGASS